MYNGAHFMSKLFRPATAIIPDKSLRISKSHKLMLYSGLIHGGAHGTFVLSPALVRSLEKLNRLVDAAMRRLNAEKIIMPALGDAALWRRSGRWNDMGSEMFRLKDRQGSDICLSPTNEEEVTNFVSSFCKNISHNRLPIRLYQTTTKFRDEGQPRFGLLRAREFVMKDLYTFDESVEAACTTYHEVLDAYQHVFSTLRVPFFQVEAATGLIGGKFSHEFHIPAEIGEDVIFTCSKCDSGQNSEIVTAEVNDLQCEKCGESLARTRAIEVGHCFYLGQKYSQAFDASFKTRNGKKETMEMGCFGIGITRLIAASLEALSTENELRWPFHLAPYRVAVVLSKEGAKDEMPAAKLNALLQTVASLCPEGDLLIDDRSKLTIGRRLFDLRRLGIPYVVVAKTQENEDRVELIDVYSNSVAVVSTADVVSSLASLMR